MKVKKERREPRRRARRTREPTSKRGRVSIVLRSTRRSFLSSALEPPRDAAPSSSSDRFNFDHSVAPRALCEA